MNRKGVIESTSHIILLVLVGGILAATLGGPMYQTIQEGFEILDRYTGVDEYQDINNPDQLADFAHYAWDRAHSCDQVQRTLQDRGYPALSDTDYTSKPACSGAPGTLAADITSNLVGDTGNDMEGRYSRIKFEIQQEIRLKSYEERYGTYSSWESNGNRPFLFKTVSQYEKGYSDWVWEDCTNRLADKPLGKDQGTNQHAWPIVFDVDQSDLDLDRRFRFQGSAMSWREAEEGSDNGPPSIRPFCEEIPGDEPGYMIADSRVRTWDGRQGRTEVILCPGDKGYIQVNKGFASTDGEFTEYDWDANLHPVQYFPYIQITSVNQSSCGEFRPEQISTGLSSGHTLYFKAQNGGSNDMDNLKEFKLTNNNPQDFECRVQLSEKDTAFDDGGHVDFKLGARLPGNSYGDDNFPGTEESIVSSYSLPGPAPPDDGGSETLYNFLAIYGLDGRDVDPNSGQAALLKNEGGQKKFEMYGDLLCVKEPGDSKAKWIACDESEFSDETEITFAGQTWRCDPRNGVWRSTSGLSYPATVTTNYYFEPPEEETTVLDSTGGELDFTPADDSRHNYITWNTIPQGEKRITFTVTFDKRGHMQLDAQNSRGETVTYINTDATGAEHVWIQKPGSYDDTGFDYETGTEYKFIIQRENGRNKWMIKSGGSTLWEYEEAMDDFTRIQMEAWNSWSGGNLEHAELTIHEVRIENNVS